MDAKIEQLRRFVAESDNIVFFGGAGVSTESGIPDFRSVDGLYHQKFKYPPETILSHHFYETHKAEFFDFYRQKMLAPDAQPNAAHRKLAELGAGGQAQGRHHPEHRRPAPEGGQPRGAGAARQRPAQLL